LVFFIPNFVFKIGSGVVLKNRPEVDFTHILRAAFTGADPPRSAKKTDGWTVFFALLGYVRIKASSKMCQFHQHFTCEFFIRMLCAAFL